MNLVEKTVKVTTRVGEVEFTGKVVKQDNHIIWIQLDNSKKDQLKFFTDWDKVEVIEYQTKEDLLEEFLTSNNYEWESYGNHGEINQSIEGFTYIVNVYFDDYLCEWVGYTTHKERFDNENNYFGDTSKADGNQVTRKSLKGITNYIKKWADK